VSTGKPLPAAIALAGPTASGKTAAAFAIADRLAARRPVEIISVDSALVYRGMDIGTAKPTPAELASVPHHLIDIRDPRAAYSAAEFVTDAERLMAEITARGHLPLLVGGTMLYFKALFEGLDAMPKADAATRAALEAEAAQQGWPAMHAQLAQIDPATAARLAPADAQRIQRALEVYRVSGRPLSAFHTGRADAPDRAAAVTLVSLEPRERAWLHARIAQRFDAMLAEGLLLEVRRLRARGDLQPDLPSMRCVGYRQAWSALDDMEAMEGAGGTAPPPAPSSTQLAALRDQGIFATRQLAKRQLTWLRSMPQRQVVAADAPDALQQVLALAERAA
jgi:tRNA dimethylallyltransferase